MYKSNRGKGKQQMPKELIFLRHDKTKESFMYLTTGTPKTVTQHRLGLNDIIINYVPRNNNATTLCSNTTMWFEQNWEMGKFCVLTGTHTHGQTDRHTQLHLFFVSYGIFVIIFAPTTWTSDLSDIAMPPEGISPLQIQYTHTIMYVQTAFYHQSSVNQSVNQSRSRRGDDIGGFSPIPNFIIFNIGNPISLLSLCSRR